MKLADKALAVVRIVLGYIFLWAFIDKTFGLGYATCKGAAKGCSQAWLHGGSPTTGFLQHTKGPLADLYHNLAGQMWVDWLFMLGLAFIGIGLLFGTWIKAASAAGIVMLLLMWSALLWPVNSPGVDEHIIYALILIYFIAHQPTAWSFNKQWLKTSLVKRFKYLS